WASHQILGRSPVFSHHILCLLHRNLWFSKSYAQPIFAQDGGAPPNAAPGRRVASRGVSDWLVERLRECGEELRPALCHVPAVLETDAELTGDIEAGFIGKAHTRLQRGRVTAHQIRRLVPVESDAVPRPMRQPGQGIVLAPALLLVVRPHRLI